MTDFATALFLATALLAANVPPEPCYWGGQLRDCKSGCIESDNNARCNGTTPILKNYKRDK